MSSGVIVLTDREVALLYLDAAASGASHACGLLRRDEHKAAVEAARNAIAAAEHALRSLPDAE